MHEVTVAHVLFGFPAGFALASRLPLGRDQRRTEVLAQVFDDECGLGNSEVADCHSRRFSKRVNGLEFGRGELRFRMPFIRLDFVGDIDLFEEPEDALRTRLLEPVKSYCWGVSRGHCWGK